METNKLPEPQKIFIQGQEVPHVYRSGGIILCSILGASKLLGRSVERTIAKAKRFDRLTLLGDRLYISADNFAFLVDEMQNPPKPAKELARKIHQISSSELIYYFLFN